MKKFSYLTQVLILTLLFAFTSCDNSITSEYRYDQMSVTDIRDITVTGSQVFMKLTVATGTPCWEYHNTKVEQTKEETLVTVIGKDKSLYCLQMLSSFETDLTLTFETSGEKLIKFWQRGDEYLELKIVIP